MYIVAEGCISLLEQENKVNWLGTKKKGGTQVEGRSWKFKERGKIEREKEADARYHRKIGIGKKRRKKRNEEKAEVRRRRKRREKRRSGERRKRET